MSSQPTRPSRRLRRRSAHGGWALSASWLLRALTAVAVLLGTLRAGSRYFYCPAMGMSLTTGCCAPSHAPVEAAAIGRADCCEAKIVEALPPVQLGDARTVPPPPIAWMALAPHPVRRAVLRELAATAARWGSDPPPPMHAQTRFMVFLI